MHKPVRKIEPIELVLIGIPVLCEAAAVLLFIVALALWAGIIGGSI